MKINYKPRTPPAVEFYSLMQGEIGTHVVSGRPFVKIALGGRSNALHPGPNACFLGGGQTRIGPQVQDGSLPLRPDAPPA